MGQGWNVAERGLSRLVMALGFGMLAGCSQLGIGGGPTQRNDIVKQDPNATIQAGQLVGGGTKQIAVETPPVGGFLPHPELLQPGGPGRPSLVYLNTSANIGKYRKIMIDPVTIWAGPNSELNKVPADQQRALANLMYSELYNALKGHCAMTQRAEPNTLHFHFALVDTKEPNATINTVATFAPYASTAYSVASFAFNKGVGYFSGTATGEGYATDAVNGTLLWQGVDKRGGTTALVANTLDNWRDIRHVFEAWGVQMRTRLQQIGICH
ncbi:MAG TPA: DUF3313 domain-containing protein [Stellaceae bacterium]|nr:DUF3313 domain-containing protein [Stellaceae bacterium]